MDIKQLEIKGEQIPYIIKSYKNAKTMKAFFKNEVLTITKPIYVSQKTAMEFVKANQEAVYKQYQKAKIQTEKGLKNWQNGEVIYYKGEPYTVIRQEKDGKQITLQIKEQDKQVVIITPKIKNENKEENKILKENIDKLFKKILKNNTTVLLQKRLPYWSSKTKLEYKTVTVRDATTRFGSCVKQTKALRFSSRLIMLPNKAVDAIIVHELCHLKHANHGPEFYKLVESFIPEYPEIDKWLKRNR